jgi:hypothetical protein
LADHLTKRAGYWHFQRRVPKEYAALDPSGVIRHSIKVSVTEDRRGIKAGKIADEMNRVLEAYWRALYEGKEHKAQDRYNEYRRLARTFEFDSSRGVQPIEAVLVKNLVALAKAFAKARAIKITTVGTNSTKTASFYTDLESGLTSCTLKKYDSLTKWFKENWPDGHTMPKLVDPKHYS